MALSGSEVEFPLCFICECRAIRIDKMDSITAPNLASNDVQIVRFDQRGWLWVGTDLGVNVFDGVQCGACLRGATV